MTREKKEDIDRGRVGTEKVVKKSEIENFEIKGELKKSKKSEKNSLFPVLEKVTVSYKNHSGRRFCGLISILCDVFGFFVIKPVGTLGIFINQVQLCILLLCPVQFTGPGLMPHDLSPGGLALLVSGFLGKFKCNPSPSPSGSLNVSIIFLRFSLTILSLFLYEEFRAKQDWPSILGLERCPTSSHRNRERNRAERNRVERNREK